MSEGADAVKIMSIHRSKGLEFPICILARCSNPFNREQKDALLHPRLGLGVNYAIWKPIADIPRCPEKP